MTTTPSAQALLAQALYRQSAAGVRRALAQGARLDKRLPDMGSHPLYLAFSLSNSAPGIIGSCLTHLRKHPEQWIAARRYIASDNLQGPVHWLCREAYFAHQPEVFERWQKLDLRLSHTRRVPLLSVCAPEMIPLLVENGAPLYSAGSNGSTPLRESLVGWSTGLGTPASLELSVSRRQSARIQAFVAAGWDPALDPCIRSIRSLANSLFRKMDKASDGVAQLPGLGVLRARLRHHSLSARTPELLRPIAHHRPRM